MPPSDLERPEPLTIAGAPPAARDLLAEDILRLPTLFANLYIVGAAQSWALIDAGLPGFARSITRGVERRFGPGARPQAIILTHGHWDHAGSALELSKQWDVPILAHPLELPYLTGKSDYAPADPTVGGIISIAARLFPSSGYDFRSRVLPLPAGGVVPGFPEWRWIHTPGHTQGHVSLFRERDAALLAGDALTTVNQDALVPALTRTPVFYRPPAPFTVDWDAAEASIHALADLSPRTVGAGHGWPLQGETTAGQLRQFASAFRRPAYGRYVNAPALAGENGIRSLPPRVPDPAGRAMALGAVAGLGALAAFLLYRNAADRDSGKQQDS
jgi:glyoxylase-like metal-dependent hydrolase (beta-lactamase superfamily II)